MQVFNDYIHVDFEEQRLDGFFVHYEPIDQKVHIPSLEFVAFSDDSVDPIYFYLSEINYFKCVFSSCSTMVKEAIFWTSNDQIDIQWNIKPPEHFLVANYTTRHEVIHNKSWLTEGF